MSPYDYYMQEKQAFLGPMLMGAARTLAAPAIALGRSVIGGATSAMRSAPAAVRAVTPSAARSGLMDTANLGMNAMSLSPGHASAPRPQNNSTFGVPS